MPMAWLSFSIFSPQIGYDPKVESFSVIPSITAVFHFPFSTFLSLSDSSSPHNLLSAIPNQRLPGGRRRRRILKTKKPLPLRKCQRSAPSRRERTAAVLKRRWDIFLRVPRDPGEICDSYFLRLFFALLFDDQRIAPDVF